MASETPNIVAVGLLRPGYSDERGNRSDGDALTATGDNYTAEVVAAVAAATEQLKSRYRARTTILVGHPVVPRSLRCCSDGALTLPMPPFWWRVPATCQRGERT
jgi:hypothetical protein